MSQPVALAQTRDLAQARQLLRAVKHHYAGRRAAAVLLPATAGALLLALLGRQWPAAQGWLITSAGLGLLVIGALLWPLRKLRPAPIVARLDRQFPALEDSTGLVLRNAEELNVLEQLQQQRVARRLHELQAAKALSLPVSFRQAGLVTGLLLVGSAVLWWLPPVQSPHKPAGIAVHFSDVGKPAAPGPMPARIAETQLLVTPPAYTRQSAFAPTQASFQCAEGARVRWLVRVTRTARAAPELELGRQRRRLQPVAGKPGWFFTEQILKASTLYRLRFAGTVSDDYAIDVRADQAPVVRIQTPKAYTLVAAIGQQPEVPIRATMRDDYGLSRAELVITVAQGQGEAVKFREVRRDLSAGLGGQPVQTSLRNQLNLPKLGLTYGDELYFYIMARDNAGHTSRTDAYLVQWQDTAVADSPSDMGMGVKVAPAYFRSQRQIIIDTEKLLAEKPRLDAATVTSRANALGLDQQTLRLRYGKFMGEEAEPGMGAEAPHSPIAEDEDADHPAPTAEAGEEHEEHHDHAARPTGANASPTAETDALMEPYIHRHDDAETADFLEPAVKAKLRAVLDQMWAAELRLRTGQLAAARPFEYRALRLLKQVQQQTRAFVKKAGFVPPPLPEATLRLTGELAGATAPHRQQMLPAPATQPAVRAALRWLSTTSTAYRANPADARLLEQAGSVLAGAALQRPGLYLPALRALRQLVSDVRAGRAPCAECRPPVEHALTDLLATPPPTPVSEPAPDRLARRYFQELSR
ncbi:hypothetical protein [Hymenobacter terrenus]|uniref:hypothetical protein n=1 Tax=Hymenobacter terrenus TaxID=1629124 RepID=UPI000ABD6A22|nr:hypothetical protein [Hymenobacter terrenus]